MKTIRYAFWAIVGLCLVLVGLANRGVVTVRAMPEAISNLVGLSPDISLPLFIVVCGALLIGIVVGFVLEWLREHRQRVVAKQHRQEASRLNQEVATLKGRSSDTQDDVLAILDEADAAR